MRIGSQERCDFRTSRSQESYRKVVFAQLHLCILAVMHNLRRVVAIALVSVLIFTSPQSAKAYGLSTHLLLVDLLWADQIKPLLRLSFPGQDDSVYERARVYAYGGALIQDAGYYIAGKEEFSDLTHYVHSGDFVTNLFHNATDVDELAFAMGALTHYVGDYVGHPHATNESVPIEFKDKQKKYGNVVTYEEGKPEHLKVEFGFDVNAAKQGRLRPPALMKGEKPDLALQQLAFAYFQTYGLTGDLTQSKEGLNANSYYLSAGFVLPVGTYSKANATFGKPVIEDPSIGLGALTNAVAAREDWKSHRKHAGLPGFIAWPILLFVSKTRIKGPETLTETKYAKSLVMAINELKSILESIHPTPGAFVPLWPGDANGVAGSPLPNVNLDTGALEAPGTYGLSDAVHRQLLQEVSATFVSKPKWKVPAAVLQGLQTYFADPSKSTSNVEITMKQLKNVSQITAGDGCPADDFGSYASGADTIPSDPQNSIPGLCPAANQTKP